MADEILLDLLRESVDLDGSYSFLIAEDQTDKVMGHAKDVLEGNRNMVKNAVVLFATAEVVVVRQSWNDDFYGNVSWDSTIMVSAIKKFYKHTSAGIDLLYDKNA